MSLSLTADAFGPVETRSRRAAPRAARSGHTVAAGRAGDASLENLLARVALGDRAAFRTLYERTCRCLLGVAHAVLHDRGLAEDVLQEVFLKVWQRAASYEAATASPMTWLINITRHRAIDVLRAHRSERVASVPDADEVLAGIAADDATNPAAELETRRTRMQLMHGLAGLGATQRQAMALAYFQGLTHQEIATTMRVPLGTAKARVRRGLEALRLAV